MSAEANRALVRRYVEEVLNGGNMDALREIFAEDVLSRPLWPEPRKPTGTTNVEGAQLIRRVVAMQRAAFPDAISTIEAMTAEESLVTACIMTVGTHTGGPFFDIPAAGKRVQWTSFSIFRFEGGRIVENRSLWDRLGVWQQLGVLPDQDALREQIKALQG